MNDYLFDADTREALNQVGAGEWTARVSPRWNIDGIPNGGYLMALCLVAAGQEVPHPDPLSMTSHFVGPTMPGEATVASRVMKRGRSLSVTAVDLVQNGRVAVTSLITWGDLSTLTGPSGPLRPPSSLPENSEMQTGPQKRGNSTFIERFEFLMPSDMAQGAAGRPTGTPEVRGRMRFADGRPPDLMAVPVFADGFPPAVFQLGFYGWAPTLELTIHFRARPHPGWLTIDLASSHLLEGTFEEDCYIWDSLGNLVAMSRQLGRTLVG
ncbi:MAG: thioesterase family protein [bacterium]|nr:thioesterase family protein [bacterium]